MAILELLQSERFIDESPKAIYATLLDEGLYCCSVSTMYRLLDGAAPVRERRQTSRNAKFAKPQLSTVEPNQVWTWDITKVPKSIKWGYYYFYAIIDLFSRLIVGWKVSETESARQAEVLIRETCWQQSIEPEQLIIHSDRGAPMKSKLVSQMFIEIGVAKSFSRPTVCNDNAFSESNFKTLKSRPTFPDSFESLAHAEAFFEELVEWYNFTHKHGGIADLTPFTVHSGKAAECLQARQRVLNKAYEANPQRFVKGNPKVRQLPKIVGINLPNNTSALLATIGSGKAAVAV
jgi:putative transposase